MYILRVVGRRLSNYRLVALIIKIVISVGDPFTNNCGPGWSDGKWQTSVDTFETQPLNFRDSVCQEHDRDSKRANGDIEKLNVADDVFFERLVSERPFELSTDYFLGLAYANIVWYGNRTARNISSMVTYDPYAQAANDPKNKDQGYGNLHDDADFPTGKKNLRGSDVSTSDSHPSNLAVNFPQPRVPVDYKTKVKQRESLPTVDMSKYQQQTFQYPVDYKRESYQDYQNFFARKKKSNPFKKRGRKYRILPSI